MIKAPILSLQNLRKSFDDTQILHGISLDVYKGEFVTLLGPSGCGKTTTLRIIAGLETPDSGAVILNGRDVTHLEPNKRNVNTVFQNYALFPHMNVEKNVGYGLRVRKMDKAAIRTRVREALEVVQMTGYEKRLPSQLSGGQRQRVAIARAIVLSPDILLLDEPLGALDQKLRQQMQEELKNLQQRLGITFIYITHDQEEALNMSNRIAVMQAGRFEQVGSPEQIYEQPQTPFVAQFIGEASVFEATFAQDVESGMGNVDLPEGRGQAEVGHPHKKGEKALLSVHTERVCYSVDPVPGFDMPATVVSRRYAGATLRTKLKFANERELTVSELFSLAQLPPPGAQVHVYWDAAHAAVVGEGEVADR